MLSKVIRRIHMYLALFLSPWILMSALSTMAMNHREHLTAMYGDGRPVWVKESETTYNGTFAPDAPPRAMAEQLLRDLHMDGRHWARKEADRLLVGREYPLGATRIVYTPADNRLVFEKEVFRTPAFLERMHRRRGFEQTFLTDDLWGFTVDLAIVSMVFWVASGLWMWLDLRPTRRWGLVSIVGGFALFALFLATI
jgi:hypothetical protein